MSVLLLWLSGTAATILAQEVYQAIVLAAFGTTSVAAAIHTAQPPAGTYIQPETTQVAVTRQAEDHGSTATPVPLVQTSTESGNRHTSALDQSSCPDAPMPQLVADLPAIRVGTIKSKLRNSAGLSAKEIGRIEVGEKVNVLGGPQCVDEFYWFNIETWDERIGWVAEGHYRSKRYWYVTLLDDSVCDLPPRFIPGDIARHNSHPSNVVRDFPARTSDERGSKIRSGNTVEVLVGPFCNDFHIWYWVRNEFLGIEGWTAEGFDGVYWFEEPKRFYN